MPSPTALTLALLRRSGFLAETVEKWIPRANRRRDLFGFGDVLGIDRKTPGLLLVQCTSLGHVANRLAKAKGRPELKAWLRAGARFAVHGWFKRGDRWKVKIVEVNAGDLAAVVVTAPGWRRKASQQRELFD